MELERDRAAYRVVVNAEEQYSIWPAARKLPLGWQAVGFDGNRDSCLAYIAEVWTDMRPLSARFHVRTGAHSDADQDSRTR